MENKKIYYGIILFISIFIVVIKISASFASSTIPVLSIIITAGITLISLLIYLKIFRFFFADIMGYDPNQSGRMAARQQDKLLLIGVLIVLFFIYMRVVKIFTTSNEVAMISASFAIFITYQLMYYYAGWEDRKEFTRKQRRREQFVNAITPDSNKCLSCFYVMEDDEVFCPKCGFDNSPRK